MKKEEIIRRCYGGMKERHGVETIILFHVGDSFEAYFDDAETITRITEVPRFKMTAAGIPAIRISDAALEECRNRLLDAGCKVCVSEVRGYPAATFSKSMKQIRKRADELILIAAAIGPWTLLVVAVLIIGTLKCCLTTDSDSIDESINKSPGIVAHVMVLDSTDNGFRVVYATAAPVTDERFAEICDRPGILEGFENLKRKTPEHFGGNLLETDICDFALYAYRFPIDKDVRIHNIFVAGKEKMDFYVRNNPDLPGCATWMHHGTEQGNQYLNADDINHCIPNGRRIYRYWKCRYLLQTSDTDERFSHFTEEERLY